jgi:geranylgeranyl pyrophosphate synthase
MRAWVTACDNILDNELKELIITDLPEDAQVFKSVHTILVTDRIFFMFLREAVRAGVISEHELDVLMNSSLSALSASGIEEAEEESGVDYSLSPDEILSRVHDAKTGQLFTSPLAAPLELGDISESDNKAAWAKEGLHTFGLACQVLDDLSDLGIDMAYRKNNYMASIITHNNNTPERKKFENLLSTDDGLANRIDLYQEFPEAAGLTLNKSLSLYHRSLNLLCDAGLPLDIAKRHSFIKILLKLFGFPKELYRIREF